MVYDLLISECVGYDPTEGLPKLTKWFKQVRESADPIYTEAHKYINGFGKKAKL